MITIEVFTTSNRRLGTIDVAESSKVADIKREVAKMSNLRIERQSIRSQIKGKDIKDEAIVDNIGATKIIYVKDLGPQIGWKTVFLLEYAGPIIIYGLVALRPWFIYGLKTTSLSTTARTALICWTIHYFKRIYETLYVHRFSHETMTIKNLFKNCTYYWGFALYIAYHVNHPLFTPPSMLLRVLGISLFTICEIGNLSIHMLLRDLRPAGTRVRKMPVPNRFPMTKLYDLVSCPNYTYEVGGWLGFTVMTSCVPAAIFTLVGFYQMTIWALGKHRTYKTEFRDYPKKRKAIVPYIL